MVSNVKQQLIVTKNELSDLMAMMYALSLNEKANPLFSMANSHVSNEALVKIFLKLSFKKTLSTGFDELFIEDANEYPEYMRLYNEYLEKTKKDLLSRLTDVAYNGFSKKLPPEKILKQFSKEFDIATKRLPTAAETFNAKQDNYEKFEKLVQEGVTMFAVTSGTCSACTGGGPYTAREMKGLDFPPFHPNCGCSVESWTEYLDEEQILSYSSEVEAFIKGWESFSLSSYDAALGLGDWTIGWGHKLHEYSGNKNNPNISWSQEKAEIEFINDMEIAANTTFNKFLVANDIKLTQNQYDAMLSWSFNFGPYIWDEREVGDKGSTMRDFLIAGDYSEEATRAAFAVYMGSRAAPGHIKRRNSEINIFLYNIYDSEH